MPSYQFQCECGVRFEARAKMSVAQEPKPCPQCGQQAARLMPQGIKGVFKQTAKGPAPQNTGVHGFDAHVDRVIGDSARQGWEHHMGRLSDKRQILRDNPQAEGEDLSRQPDGSYQIMGKDERGVHERANAINSAAMSTLKKAKKS